MQKVEVFGEVPLARFGHTITLVSKKKAVMFGGATGDTGKYIITGDTYVLELPSYKWTKLEGTASRCSPTQRPGSPLRLVQHTPVRPLIRFSWSYTVAPPAVSVRKLSLTRRESGIG